MADPGGQFVFRISANAQQLLQEFGKVDTRARGTARKLESEFGQTSRTLLTVGRSIAGAFGVGLGLHLIVQGFRAIASEAIRAERNVHQLTTTLRATGNAAGVTRSGLAQQADELRRTTIFDDDQVREAQIALLRFRDVQREVFNDVMRLAPDVATALGTDLVNAAQALGRAVTDPATGMRQFREAGVFLSDAQKDLAARFIDTGNKAAGQKIVLEEITRAVGGLSQSDNTGLYGAVKRLDRAWSDLLKSFGQNTFGDTTARTISSLAAFIDRQADRFKPPEPGTREVRGRIRQAGEPILSEDQRAAEDAAAARRKDAADKAKQDAIDALQRRAAGAATYYAHELATARHFIAEREQLFDFAYRNNTLATSEFYAGLRALSDETTDAELRNIDKQIRAKEAAFRAIQPAKAEERQKFQEDVRALADASQQAIQRRAARAVELQQDEAQAVRDLTNDYELLRIKLLELQGDTVGAARARFNFDTQAQRDRIGAELESGDPKARERAAAALANLVDVGRLTAAQAAFAREQERFGDSLERLGIGIERVNLAREAGAVNELAALDRVSQANQAILGELREWLARMTAIANATGDREMLRNLERYQLQIEKIASETDLAGDKFRDIFKESFNDPLKEAIRGTISLADAVDRMADRILDRMTDIALDNISTFLFGGKLGNFLMMLLGGGGGGVDTSWLAGLGGGAGNFNFGGGFARGGFPPVGKWSAVGERGGYYELIRPLAPMQVASHRQSRAMMERGGAQTFNINLQLPAGTNRESANQLGLAVARETARIANRNG